ncbi:MAG: CoA transferase [Pseudomonadota bacterium]
MTQETEQESALPLEGTRVVDLTRLAAGNMLTHMLADFGAEVIKIERPGVGDDLRRFGKAHTWWKVYARSKKSLTLNIRSEEGKAVLRKLIAQSDMLVENFVPGTLEAWGLGPEALWEVQPNLIIVRVSGWGQTGPYAKRPGFGSLIEALSGFAAMTGFPDKPPLLPPIALADMVAGLAGFGGAVTALLARETGRAKGQVIDLSLFEPLHAILGPWAANYVATGTVPRREGNSSEVAAPRGVYSCGDGHHIAMSASMQSMWEQLARAMGREELIEDPKYKTNLDRVKHHEELDAIIDAFFAQRTLEENLAFCAEAGLTVGPICDASDLVTHEYIRGRGVLVDVEDADLGSIPMHQVFPRLSETPGQIRRPAPSLGQDTDEILELLGIGPEEAKALAAQKVV